MKIYLITAVVFCSAWIVAWVALLRPLLLKYNATAGLVERIKAAENIDWSRFRIWLEAKKTLVVAFVTSAFAAGKAASDQTIATVATLQPGDLQPLGDKSLWSAFFDDVWTLHIIAALGILTAFLTLKGKVQAAKLQPKA